MISSGRGVLKSQTQARAGSPCLGPQPKSSFEGSMQSFLFLTCFIAGVAVNSGQPALSHRELRVQGGAPAGRAGVPAV